MALQYNFQYVRPLLFLISPGQLRICRFLSHPQLINFFKYLGTLDYVSVFCGILIGVEKSRFLRLCFLNRTVYNYFDFS